MTLCLERDRYPEGSLSPPFSTVLDRVSAGWKVMVRTSWMFIVDAGQR
jgi:hypothetical protein